MGTRYWEVTNSDGSYISKQPFMHTLEEKAVYIRLRKFFNYPAGIKLKALPIIRLEKKNYTKPVAIIQLVD